MHHAIMPHAFILTELFSSEREDKVNARPCKKHLNQRTNSNSCQQRSLEAWVCVYRHPHKRKNEFFEWLHDNWSCTYPCPYLGVKVRKRGKRKKIKKKKRTTQQGVTSKPACQKGFGTVLFSTLFLHWVGLLTISTNTREIKGDGRRKRWALWCVFGPSFCKHVFRLTIYLFIWFLHSSLVLVWSGQAATLYVMQVHLFFSPFFVFPSLSFSRLLSHKQINK